MKVTAASVLIAAAAIVPVIANGFEAGAEDSLVIREDNEFENFVARDFDLELEEREFEDDLFEREPGRGKFLKKAFKFGGKAAKTGSALSSVTPPQTPSETREFIDDLLEREEFYERAGGAGPSTRGAGPSTRGAGPSTRGAGPSTRGAGPSTRGAGPSTRGAGPSTRGAGPSTRGTGPRKRSNEFDDDLLEREFDEELSEREFDEELAEREVEEELMEREIDGDELFGRDVDEELFEREPEPILFINHMKKWLKNRKAKNTAAAEDAPAETRSFDEVELLERGYYDELD
jgi:hypothetical protein